MGGIDFDILKIRNKMLFTIIVFFLRHGGPKCKNKVISYLIDCIVNVFKFIESIIHAS